MEFQIDASGPIYRQLVEQILARIKTGELQPGDRLPTERELAAQLGVARGTVKKAYRELADNNIIEVIQGSGSYVYAERKLYDGQRRQRAVVMIEELLDKLEMWDFPVEEIDMLLHMCSAHRVRPARPVRCAIIDCNPESLGIFKRQLAYIPNITLSAILVDSVIMDDAPQALLSDYDLIFTSETHYDQVAQCLGSDRSKLFPASVSLSRQSIIHISTIPRGAAVAAVCTSNKFYNLICEELALAYPLSKPLPVHFDLDAESILRFISKYDTVIVSPDSIILEPDFADGRLQAFLDRGGQLISFDYMIDRGSLIHIEELVSRVLQEKYAPERTPVRKNTV